MLLSLGDDEGGSGGGGGGGVGDILMCVRMCVKWMKGGARGRSDRVG